MTERRRSYPLSRGNPLGPVYVSVLLFMTAEGALHILLPPFLSLEHGLGPAAIGALVGVFAAASLAARLPAGMAYTVARARLLLLMGGSASALAFVLLPLAPNALAIGGLMVLDGLGWSVATTTQMALVLALKPKETPTGSAMGWYAGFTGLGNASAGIGGGLLAELVGLSPSFVVLSFVLVLGTALMVRAVPRSSARVERKESAHRSSGVAGVHLFGTIPAVVWAAVVVMFYINFVNGIANTFHPLLALSAGLTLWQIGFLASCRGWTSSASRMTSGAVFSRYSAARLTTPLVLMASVSLFLISPLRGSFALQIPLFLAMGLSRGLLRVTASVSAFEGVGNDERRHGLTAALLHGGLDAGKIAGPVLGGFLAHAIGLAAMFQVVPVVLVAVYGVLLLGARRSTSRRPAVSQ